MATQKVTIEVDPVVAEIALALTARAESAGKSVAELVSFFGNHRQSGVVRHQRRKADGMARSQRL